MYSKINLNNAISHKEVGKFEETRYEKLHTEIFDNADNASFLIAQEIATLIKSKQEKEEHFVIGLATGSSPIKVYEELVRLHKEEALSFHNVITFNLDEYFPMKRANNQSYDYFMHQHLFNHIDINPNNINIPDGTIPVEEVHQYCIDYEMKIKQYGGLDFQLLGIGRTGHIGFNEPGSHHNSGTRIIMLSSLTRVDASSDFNGLENVPRKAITMGVGTICKAKRIVLLAWGDKKATIVKNTIEDPITANIPATYLQNHNNITVILDREAAAELKRFKTPWLVGQCVWTISLKRKAIVWLSQKLEKPILKLTDKDYNEHGMSGLLALEGSAYDLNIKMFNILQRTITGWPGGKPNSDDEKRPERAYPAKKRVLIFSPHPEDDMIAMGGTFSRLVKQGHEVYVAYQTSGNIAVTDMDALKFAEVSKQMFSDNETTKQDTIITAIKNKTEGDIDALDIRKLKGLIRRMEAYASTRYLGLDDANVHFLNLPFYETGEAKKNPLSVKDITIMENIINKIQPHQIYAPGDLTDPHGTHKVCLNAVYKAIENIKEKSFMNECWVWLYRGAWQEWNIDEIDMAVPLSPDELQRKTNAILFHQSQKDLVMFQGDDTREFWVRAQERNRETADHYNSLGLSEYEGIEAFKRYYF